ncbi:MAG: glycoside hydrolase family 9 protein [Bacteroidales bacterium]|nr:glycoside hydrolase family 9 protein [Candidatus Cacconaster merdequi]
MKRFFIPALAMLIAAPSLSFAQIDEQLKQDIIESGYVHKPLTLRDDKSIEAAAAQKKVISSKVLCNMESLEGWSHKGHGSMALTDERSKDGGHSLRMLAETMPEGKTIGMGRGSSYAIFNVGGADWREYNRVSLSIFPSCEGARSIYLTLCFENDGAVKVPDRFGREGLHEINLKNNQWNECSVEISGLSRDRITKIQLVIETFGKDVTMGDFLQFDIDDIRLETVENPEAVRGWTPAENRIVFSNSGYTTGAEKSAVVNLKDDNGTFRIKDYKTGRTVYKGKISERDYRIGNFRTIDFSSLTKPGQYVIEAGGVTTWPFYIHDDVWENSAWRVVNFLFCERCGYPVPGKHGECHADLHAEYNGKVFPLNGGWHDAGDMAQQTLQSGEIAYSLLQMAQTAKRKGNVNLYRRMMEEGLWGIDFLLRSRLGDGYRAMSWGTNLWTDRILNTKDDADRRQINVNDGAYENFVLSGIEAYAAMVIDDDPELVTNLTKVAQEDFWYAKKRFDKYGFAELGMVARGHAKNTPESQYRASVSWAASMIYKLTGDKRYAEQAAEFIKMPMECQQKEAIGGGIKGFFYGDKDRHSGVHYSHKSSDYAFMEAFAALCETQSEHPDYNKWMDAIRLYAGYLKQIMAYVQPYGMVPSGIYNINEFNYPELFYPWQLGAPRDSTAGEIYRRQLENGIKLDNENYLRFFPVWYSFKGNTVVSLATGKAAAICARVLGDKQLKEIAERQLSWVVGYNPFGQSLIYGEGSNWCQQYCALPGEVVGEIPVGMQAYFDEDAPYWPQINTATYKEVFGLTASRWLMLVSEF